MNILGFTFTYAHLIYTIALVILGFLVSYYKANAKFRGYIATLINDAESLTSTGAEKKAWVVDQIYAILPTWLKPVLSKTILGMMVQAAFDSMKQYATKLMDAATDKLTTDTKVTAIAQTASTETKSNALTDADANTVSAAASTPATTTTVYPAQATAASSAIAK